MKFFTSFIRRSIFLLPLFCCFQIFAQVNITSTTTAYTQNFNTLITSGTSSVLPTGWKLLETGTNANTTLAAGTGSATTGDSYSFGTGTATDRAFGALLSGSLTSTIGAQVKNSSGQNVTSITISYTGEQWRCGATGRSDRLDFQYSLNATSLSTGTWLDVNTLDFASPSTTSTGAKDGNAAANRSAKSETIGGLNIVNNGIFWIRWNDADATGADDGLSIDDVSIKLNAGDLTAPIISTLNPANTSTNIATSGNLVITFNENIQKGMAGDIVIKKTADGTVINTTAVTATNVSISGAEATIPYSALGNSTSYYVEVSAGSFKDLAGNNFAGITGNAVWSFTTMAAAAPAINVNPASLDFGFVAAGATSPNKTFSFTATNLTANLTLTAPANFILSKDGGSFTTTLSYTTAEIQTDNTVTVRFNPTVANTNYSGLINFTSTGLNSNQEQLSGNSNDAPAANNYYFGNLHAHSSYSDGNKDDITKIPADDYAFAKNSLCFDFLGISEHNHPAAGMNIADWQPGINQAAAATTSTFVGLYGMEWGVISGGGHVIVYGMDSLIGWDAGQNQVYVPKSVYKGAGGLFEILNRHGGNALAYLAHPNTADYNDLLNGAYDLNADNAVVGSTVESGPAFSTNVSYTEPGASLSYISYYRNMLAKGYHLGPTIDHDNHNMTFGRTAKTRLVIMAPSLTENNLLAGMRNMRFYASQDCSAKIDYSINTQAMGSIVTNTGAPIISVSSITTNPVSSVSVMAGVPGSGAVATQLTSSTTGNFTFTDNTLANLSQKYYYLEITETDGAKIVTSPIWYTRDDAALRGEAPISSFYTINETDRVILKWTTNSSSNNEIFEVERSVNEGRTYETIGLVKGKKATNSFITYGLPDMAPYAGVAYYRLVKRNVEGLAIFSDVRVVNRTGEAASYYSIYPNPVRGILTIKISSPAQENTLVQIFDLTGKRLISRQATLAKGEQNVQVDMSSLGNGSYILKFMLGNKLKSQIINKF